MKYRIVIVFISFLMLFSRIANAQVINQLLLNGKWQTGAHRQYSGYAQVPGLVTDPGKVNPDTLWLKRVIKLPAGNWMDASLELKGARFCPSVYVNGDLVFKANGGMAPIYQRLKHPGIKPGQTITLEIALLPLSLVPVDDASRIPAADLWRSNVSSCIWDDVVLHLHQYSFIKSIVPQSNFAAKKAFISYDINAQDAKNSKMDISLADVSGKVIQQQNFVLTSLKGKLVMPLDDKIKAWSPDHPVLYKLSAKLIKGNVICDSRVLNYGFKQFIVDGLKFNLNEKPVQLRAASIVWHRWVRDPQAKEIAWDSKWFEQNIVKRLKVLGANTIRFHLGLPPERLLDLCDKYGLMVQSEWSFFHGMKASPQSLQEQWPAWFNASLKHPCVVLMHGWNETEGENELKLAFESINKIAADYEPIVIGHRDVIHIHKYWWSLFENLGLYYDSYKQFPKPIMVDEFGGNYLDENGDIGKYPTNAGSFARFVGKNSTKEERLYHHAISNSKVAEYWRRVGAAGFSPFCALSSPEDGNTWFLGPLRSGIPKPAWADMRAAYAPVSVSLNIWDRHFEPGAAKKVQAYFFNDSENKNLMRAKLMVVDKLSGKVVSEVKIQVDLDAHQQAIRDVVTPIPKGNGSWSFVLKLEDEQGKKELPIASTWDFETHAPVLSKKLRSVIIGTDDSELKGMLKQLGLHQTGLGDLKADVYLLTGKNWAQRANVDSTNIILAKLLTAGKRVVILDMGPKLLGQGYKNGLGSLQSAPALKYAVEYSIALPFNMHADFKEVAEPESNIQYATEDSTLWHNLHKNSTWLWNGYRGGLIMPAADMQLTGLNELSYLKSWKSRGADESRIKAGNYYSYELAGFYDFADKPNDTEIENRLRKKVHFLVDDAPALKDRINPDVGIKSTSLSEGYRESGAGKVRSFLPLVSAGKDLARTPAALLTFKDITGELIISQLLTEGRLVKAGKNPIGYQVRYDPVAIQFVLNMMNKVLNNN